MAEAFIGEIRLFGFSYAPKNWAACNGQLLPISQNTALFSVIGTAFGGNGTATFGLPNLQNNLPLGAGQAVSGTNYPVGQVGGQKSVVIDATMLPSHSHGVLAASTRYGADSNVPGSNKSLAPASGCTPFVSGAGAPTVTMDPNTLSPVGTPNQAPHPNMMPSLVINMCICVNGLLPPRG